MKRTAKVVSATLCFLVAVAVYCHGSGVAFGADAKEKPASTVSSAVKFRPPRTGGAPAVRLTGGSRGTGERAVTLDVLAPAEVGETTQEQPTLFWYQSRPSESKFELTLLQENKVKPLVQIMVDRAAKAGIQSLKLSDHGVKLQPDVEYQWNVALISDLENRSTDQIATGGIKRIVPGPDLKEKVAKAAPEAEAAIYADAGVWYDALAAISNQIETHPADQALRQARADLLRQVGLTAAAQYDGMELTSATTKN